MTRPENSGPAGDADSTGVALRVYAGAFVDELALAGVRDVCICPGSRSTPLAMLLREHPSIRVWTHLDERSAGFFALGMAKAAQRAVAVLCTSGTAAANFMPAVAEAHNAGVPLIVLTADRPQELRDVGALQTIDQVRLYGSHAKWAVEMLLPEATEEAARHARYAADRSVATALSAPMGPVHLNFPFREPLVPAPAPETSRSAPAKPQTTVEPRGRYFRQVDVEDLATRLRTATRGLIVAGPAESAKDAEELEHFRRGFAAGRGLPILADVLSQVRCGPVFHDCVIDRFDAFLRSPEIAELLRFDYVLRIGNMPVSKPLQQFLDRNRGAVQIVVGSYGSWPDTTQTATHLGWGDGWLGTESVKILDALWDRKRRGMPLEDPYAAQRQAWLDTWRRINAVTGEAIESSLGASDCMSEPLVFRRLADLVPEDSIVFAGNSMPVRDLDSFWPASTRRVRFMANRGASGIDGVVSTALGAAAASPDRRLVLVIGDISLYHDMNGLLAARRHNLNATIVLLNNDGGGIFSFLPQAEQGEHFEELFGTPHGLDFRHAARMYGLDYSLTATRDEFDDAVVRSFQREGVALIEVRTDRNENLALHRKIWADVSAALEKT
jgi:2-succinyl-5-enolpyruvyl-6-hydroxy-3-cyclohexene-1-carboxylate synthase